MPSMVTFISPPGMDSYVIFISPKSDLAMFIFHLPAYGASAARPNAQRQIPNKTTLRIVESPFQADYTENRGQTERSPVFPVRLVAETAKRRNFSGHTGDLENWGTSRLTPVFLRGG